MTKEKLKLEQKLLLLMKSKEAEIALGLEGKGVIFYTHTSTSGDPLYGIIDRIGDTFIRIKGVNEINPCLMGDEHKKYDVDDGHHIQIKNFLDDIDLIKKHIDRNLGEVVYNKKNIIELYPVTS